MIRRNGYRVGVVIATLSLPLSPTAGLVGQDDVGNLPAVLSIPISVRSAGLNGAGAAVVGHAGAVFANPAGIATIRHIGLEGGYRTFADGGRLANGALAWRMGQFDIGLGGGYLDYGLDPGALLPVVVPSGVAAREYAGIGSLVYRFGMIAFGGSVKHIQRKVTDAVTQKGTSADVGAAIAVFDILAIGFSMQNIGGNWDKVSTIDLPRLTRFGFTMNYVDPQETFRLSSTLEWQWPQNRSSRFIAGVEAGIVIKGVGLIGRGAYGSRSSESSLSKFTVGATVAITRLLLDYAYQESDLLGQRVHRFGLRLSL